MRTRVVAGICCASTGTYGAWRLRWCSCWSRGDDVFVKGPLGFDEAREALAVYRTVTAFINDLDPGELQAGTGCRGWTVGDLLFHLTCDAQRALVAFATPSESPPNVDYASYWDPFLPGGDDALAHARWIRVSASALSPPATRALWTETAAAVVHAADRIDPAAPVATQGHVLTPADFLATLAVEAAIHYLDLTLEFHGAAPPPPASLHVVRCTLDARLGSPVLADWDDITFALKGTGRVALDADDLAALGDQSQRLPLFG